MNACRDFVEITKLVVKSDLDFTMWASEYDANIGINIVGNNGNIVDIAQYMSPITRNGKCICVPIGLNTQYIHNGKATYDEGGEPEELMQKIVKFLTEEV